jgi:phosphoglycolate phosphatase-like HAD superfamily hydrolase
LGESVDGWMDKLILSKMIERLGCDATDDNVARGRRRMEEIFRSICQEVLGTPPGVVETLDLLAAQPAVTMGVASGNFAGIARHKLELAGLARYFPDRIGGLGMFLDRADALKAARAQAEALAGGKFDICVHIGDTPGDVRAAIKTGAVPFAVRTGRVHYPDYPGAEFVFNDIGEGRAKLWEVLGLE